MNDCRHCPDTDVDHKYVCDCGHSHDMHVLFGPCTRKSCSCDGYSQKKQNWLFGRDVRNKGIAPTPTQPMASRAAVGGVILP